MDDMTLEHTTDMLGQELRPGDTIAAAFRAGNSSELRIGTVVGFATKKDAWYGEGTIDVMEVQWLSGSPGAWLPEGKKSKIEVTHRRFVKIALDTPSEGVV